ncbi:kelch protein 24 [Biomphalaria glabrata]|nr:kelch protein 24 [Biomphalaria glabrata]
MANQATTFKSKKLKEAAWNMIVKEFNDISMREDFFLLESEDLLQVINSEDLAVDSEDYVINAIVKWVQHSPEVSDRKFYDDSEKDYKSREKQPQRENSSLKKRKNDIVDMLKASRLCLASRSCLQSLLDVHVIAENNKCFSVMRQALQYHLQPENHGYHCPSQAIHRASSKFENVILSVNQCKEYNLSCRALDGTWYHMSSPPHIPTDVVSYGTNIYSFGNQGNAYDYYEYDGFTNMYKYCTALGKWKALPGLVNDDTFSLIGLDRYLYAVSNIIYRLIITDGASEEWENVGKIPFCVHPIILSTCGSSIVILGNDRKSGQFKVQLFDTLTLTCCVYTDQLPFEMINFVTFRVFNDSYILLSTGEVLKLATCDKNKIQFENKGKLFERPLTLNAAVAFKDSLIIAASNYPQPNIKRETDIIDHVKTVELIDRPSRGLFNTTIPKIQLVNKDLNYTDVGKGFRRQGKKY